MLTCYAYSRITTTAHQTVVDTVMLNEKRELFVAKSKRREYCLFYFNLTARAITRK